MMYYLILFSLIGCFQEKQMEPIESEKNFPSDSKNKIVKVKGQGIPCENNHVLCVEFHDDEGKKQIIITEEKTNYESNINLDNENQTECISKLNAAIILNGEAYVKVYDFIECPEECKLNYIPNSLKITDLNNNGKIEITFLYSLACMTDVVPADMKLIMIEGKQKFKIRGSRSFLLEEDAYPSFNIDDSFKKAPVSFLDFATNLWNESLYDPLMGGSITPEKQNVLKEIITKNNESKKTFLNQ